ncbi:HAUS augmin-like complex subunit 7 isoform X2 [Pseudophryne corroboree]|uniref:HAUS augmin-like complex subunit 7 isoform X2 n=1 Tax=Pseudophryne corroboree TaxID=495146 RepID=UPI003081F67C
MSDYSVYPPLQDQFSSLKESQVENKVKEMAKLGFELMLCRSEDVDLIKGHVSPCRQLSFMGHLLDVLPSPTHVPGNSAMESSSHSAVSCARENEEFLRELFSSAHFQATLTPECNPWPADLKPNLLTEEQQKRTVPADKDNVITDYLEELQKITMDLQDLKEECTFLCSAVPGGDTVTQTLRLALTDFHQLITAFTEVYENEFHEHCGHLAPQISSSGPLFQSIHSLLGICIKKLEAIAQFTETSNTIVEVVRKRQQCKESWGGSSAATLYEKIQELKQNYEVFRRPWQE